VIVWMCLVTLSGCVAYENSRGHGPSSPGLELDPGFTAYCHNNPDAQCQLPRPS
jgi:hypothetical protein